MPLLSASASKTLSVLSISFSLSLAPGSRQVPDGTITFVPRVTIGGSPASGRSVKIQLQPSGLSSWYDIASCITGADGSCSASWTVPWTFANVLLPCKTHYVRIVDTATGVTSQSYALPIFYETRFEYLRTDKDQYGPGESINVEARLLYRDLDRYFRPSWFPLAGRRVLFILRDSAGTRVAEAAATTDSNGVASAVLRAPSTPGSYTLEAYFAGGTLGFAVSSRLVSVSGAVSVLSSLVPLFVAALMVV
jgi:hypothetical protein